VVGGLDLSTLPWYVWAGAAVAVVALFASTRK
jgi:hypothetical protein